MPAEQTGLVRENYLWKVLLRKGVAKDGLYYHVNSGQFDQELFGLIWAPIVAALSFVFDKSEEQPIYKKAMTGFQKCAFISSHFGMTKNLDMLIQTLAKFTTFHNIQRPNNGTISFGANIKARLSLKCVTDLCHHHGDSVREGWKNLFDLVLSLYCLGLLPKVYVEAEDFIQSSGRIVLVYEEVENLQKQDAGLFSSLYSYMVSSENLSKVPTIEEQQHIDVAKETIKDCNFEQIITDSKFLHDESLKELVKALVELSRGPDVQKSLGYNYNENVAVFFLELLIKIVIQNRWVHCFATGGARLVNFERLQRPRHDHLANRPRPHLHPGDERFRLRLSAPPRALRYRTVENSDPADAQRRHEPHRPPVAADASPAEE
jgi:brefeldin A-resistance guanine nucleotide exchange factor 1